MRSPFPSFSSVLPHKDMMRTLLAFVVEQKGLKSRRCNKSTPLDDDCVTLVWDEWKGRVKAGGRFVFLPCHELRLGRSRVLITCYARPERNSCLVPTLLWLNENSFQREVFLLQSPCSTSTRKIRDGYILRAASISSDVRSPNFSNAFSKAILELPEKRLWRNIGRPLKLL